MSTLRKSHSSSYIPRLSRIAVRQSNAPRPPRSSSARSSGGINRNLLSVPGSGTLGRSSSYSNLTTPIRIIPSTSSSGSSSVSKNFRMNDKEWQKVQAIRVRNFLAIYDPEMPPLKPLSIRAYVHSMDILFKQLDGRISITMENYKESVPDYLKSFRYKYNIKPSVMKTPAVPSSWQYILQIWIWLIDLIELLHNPERTLLSGAVDNSRSRLFYTTLNYMAASFRAFNKSEDQDKVNQDFVNNLAQIKNINLHDTTSALNEDSLDSQLNTLIDVEQTTVAAIQEVSEKLKQLQDSNATCIQLLYDRRSELVANAKQIHIKCKNIEIELNEAKCKKEQLDGVISAQTCTKSEMKQLKEKYEETRNIEQMKLQCLKGQEQLMEDYSEKINQQKYTIQSTVHKINNRIALLSCKAPQLKGIKMPEENIHEPGYEEHLTEFIGKFEQAGKDLQILHEKLTQTLHEEQRKRTMDELKRIELDVKMAESDRILKEKLKAYAVRKEGLYDKIRKAQTDIMEREKTLDQLIKQTADLKRSKEEYENMLDVNLKRCADLKRSNNESLVEASKLIVFVHNEFVKAVNDYCEKRSILNNTIAHYVKVATDSSR